MTCSPSLSLTSSKQNGRIYCPVSETGRSDGKGYSDLFQFVKR